GRARPQAGRRRPPRRPGEPRHHAVRRPGPRPPRPPRAQRPQARRPDPRPGGGRPMNVDEALIRLGESTSEAVAGILQMFAGDAAQPGPVAIVSAAAAPPGSRPPRPPRPRPPRSRPRPPPRASPTLTA